MENVKAQIQSVASRLIGAWKLGEWSEIRADGSKAYPLGKDAIGQILYSADGHVAAQLVRSSRTSFGSEDWRAASYEEGARSFKEYFGYFGTFSIDMSQKAVVHHVEGAWFQISVVASRSGITILTSRNWCSMRIRSEEPFA